MASIKNTRLLKLVGEKEEDEEKEDR